MLAMSMHLTGSGKANFALNNQRPWYQLHLELIKRKFDSSHPQIYTHVTEWVWQTYKW